LTAINLSARSTPPRAIGGADRGRSALPAVHARDDGEFMGTTMLPTRGPDVRSEESGRGRFARALLTLETGLCAAAAGGAYYLVTTPHDAMPASALARTPFSTWVVPGVLLAVCVAAPAGVVAFGAAARRAYAHAGHPLLGLALMGWIVVQVAVIGPVSWLQPAMFAWGLAILVLGSANYRRWHTGWGATPTERTAAMAGDELIIGPHFTPTRAVTIDAPPEAVWPWIVQMGYGRAGWYSYDLVDNLGHHSAERIEPRWQDVHLGDAVPMSGRVDDRTAFRVCALTPYRAIVWAKPDSTWSWRLRPTATGGTRLVTRVRARYTGPGAPLSAALMEIGDFPMMRRCLLGIKARAERSARPPKDRHEGSGDRD